MRVIICILFALFVVTSIQAATIHVPADQPTIQAGINAAVNGDTVLVAPGEYAENVDFLGKLVVVSGTDASCTAILRAADSTLPVVRFANGESCLAKLQYATITGAVGQQAIQITSSSPTISKNIFSHNRCGQIIRIMVHSSPEISNNLFYANPNVQFVILGGYDSLLIVNNTIDSAKRGISLSHAGSVVKNNILTNCSVVALIVAVWAQRGYNNLWGNAMNYSEGTLPDLTDVIADPEFESTATGNYHLMSSSSCVDGGDANPQYNDADGTVNDIGAYPFDKRVLPIPAFIGFSPAIIEGVVGTPNPVIHWEYSDSALTSQVGFEIEIGDDRDWHEAEMWSSGSIASSEPQVIYAGDPLQDFRTYYVRVRLCNSQGWGSWCESRFKVHYLNVLSVPQRFATIQTAIDASIDGDTVLVAPGIYIESLYVGGKCVHVLSDMGPEVTSIRWSGDAIYKLRFEYASGTLSGFSFSDLNSVGVYGIYFNHADVVVQNNRFNHISNVETVVSVENNSSVVVSRNVFSNIESRTALAIGGNSTADIYNNTVRGARSGVGVTGTNVALVNNIFTQCSSCAICGNSGVVLERYNCLWANGQDISGVVDSTDVLLNPKFASSDLAICDLSASSPCINSGNPDSIYRDPDGTRSDIGAIPYSGGYPAACGLTIPSETLSHVLGHSPTFNWSYTDTLGPQVAFQIEVSSDINWDHADKWSTGTLLSEDTTINYGGTPLEDGKSYWVRVKVHNGSMWSAWSEIGFHMNASPTIPQSLFPLDSTTTGEAMYLVVANSSDVDDDELKYDFQVYGDIQLSDLVLQATLVNQGQDSTVYTEGLLEVNHMYWWRTRAFDGFEYSDWSRATVFGVDLSGYQPTVPGVLFPPNPRNEPVFSLLPAFIWMRSVDTNLFDRVVYRVEIATDSLFKFKILYDDINDTLFTLTDSLLFSTHYWWRVTARDKTGLSTVSNVADFWTWALGDINHSHLCDLSDLSALVSYLTGGGYVISPKLVGDLNGSCFVDLTDLSMMVSYLTGGGAVFKVGCE